MRECNLKGKLVTNTDSKIPSINDELIEALTSLGYKSADIKKITPKIDNTLTIENQIKEALKLLLK